MIFPDVESEVYGEFALYMAEKFPELSLSNTEDRSPAKFPHLSLVEADNVTRIDTADSGSVQNHVNVMFEMNIYTNRSGAPKSQAKAIYAEADAWFLRHGFVRTMKQPVNMDDATKHRIVARYTGCVDKNMKVYRR